MNASKKEILDKINANRMNKFSPKECPAPTAATVDGAKIESHHDKINIIEIKQDVQHESRTELDRWIDKLNKKHAVVMAGGKCVVLNEEYDDSSPHPDITLSTSSNFVERYRNIKIDGTSIGNLWLDSPRRRQYKKIDFLPGRADTDVYNLYRGLAVEAKSGNWDLFDKHIREVIACGDIEIYEYILDWMANAVQNPGGDKPGVAIVLRGIQGTGKSLFGTIFGELFGGHFKQITSQKQITGNFNNHLKDALLVLCDEGHWAGSKQAEGNLKALITEDKIMIEPKGKDAFMVQNNIRLIMASNNDWVAPAGIGERRYFVLDVSDSRKGDYPYFKELCDQMYNMGGIEAMLHDLLNRDLSGVELRNYPRTKALLDQYLNTLDSVGLYWFNALVDGSLEDSSDWPDEISVDRLFLLYRESANVTGGRYKVDKAGLGRQLKKFCKIEKKRKGSGSAREQYYKLPNLEECRKQFAAKIDIEIDWDDQ